MHSIIPNNTSKPVRYNLSVFQNSMETLNCDKLTRKQVFTINFQSYNFKEFRYIQILIKNQKYKIDCHIKTNRV